MAFRPVAPTIPPSALAAFLRTHPYEFPPFWLSGLPPLAPAATAAIAPPGTIPPGAPGDSIAVNLPPATPEQTQPIPPQNIVAPSIQTVLDYYKVGEAQVQPVTYAAAGSQLVLPRAPNGKRTLLIIVNDFAVGVIRFMFNTQASAVLGVQIPALGNVFFDSSVPQQDVYVFAPAGGQITICYINVPNPQ
jgi:hypothetical protein